MTKKTVFGLIIISLLFLGGCSKKTSDPNEIEKAKAENAALKAKIQQLEAINAEQQKKNQQLAQTKVAVEPKITPIPKKEINRDANEFVVKINKNTAEQQKEKQQLDKLDRGIEEMVRRGLIHSVNFERKEISMDPDIWFGFTLEEKKEVIGNFATYFELKTGSPFVTILNSRSDTKLATYDLWGPTFYE